MMAVVGMKPALPRNIKDAQPPAIINAYRSMHTYLPHTKSKMRRTPPSKRRHRWVGPSMPRSTHHNTQTRRSRTSSGFLAGNVTSSCRGRLGRWVGRVGTAKNITPLVRDPCSVESTRLECKQYPNRQV